MIGRLFVVLVCARWALLSSEQRTRQACKWAKGGWDERRIMSNDQDAVERIVSSIKCSKKYRDTYEGTIRALATVEVGRHRRTRDAEKAVRRRLHLIVASHLGDPDYDEAATALAKARALGDGPFRSACRAVLAAHVSTRERLPILADFYPAIWELTGKPRTVLDIACGLNPIAILEEREHRVFSRALSGLLEYDRLFPFEEFPLRLQKYL